MAKSTPFGTVTKLAGGAMVAIGGLDLAFGDTNQPVLPEQLTNMLNQQIDLVLIGVGAFLLFTNF